MATTEKRAPQPRHPEGEWENVFSYHPFEPVLDRAEGIYLYDEDGNRYIDASGGPIAMNLGHNDPRIARAIQDQLEHYAYCHPVLSSRVRADLCTKVAGVAPGSLNATYLVSGGSEAVETAMKLARQAQVLRGHPDKHKIISNYDSYHGMTIATMALSGNPSSQRHFEPMIQKWPKMTQYSPYRKPDDMDEIEWAKKSAQALEEAIHYAGPHTVAAYIATPVGSASDYGVVAPKEYWQAVREICDANDVLFIADEVVTGFGRTGKWFAMEHFGVQADIMTMGKGISSLYVPLGGVVVSDEINEPFKSGAGFVHGFTHGGHGLASAVGCATLDIIVEDKLVENAADTGDYLQTSCDETLRQHPTVFDIRGKGLLRVVELVKDTETMGFFERDQHAEVKLQSLALKNGLAFYATLYGSRRGPGRNRGLPLFLSPPLCITREQVDDLVDRLDQTLTDWERELGVA